MDRRCEEKRSGWVESNPERVIEEMIDVRQSCRLFKSRMMKRGVEETEM